MSPPAAAPTDRDALIDRLDGVAWRPAVATGVAAVIVGYVLTGALVVVGPGAAEGTVVGVLTAIAFVFYSAHSVPVVSSDGTVFDWLSYLASPAADPAVSPLVYYAIPIVLLVAAGFVAVDAFVGERFDPFQTIVGVGCLAIGYAIPFVLGALVVTGQAQDGGTIGLVATDAAVFGLAYPLVFGTLGAGIATVAASLRRGG